MIGPQDPSATITLRELKRREARAKQIDAANAQLRLELNMSRADVESKTLFVEYKYVKSLPKKDTTVIRHSLSALQCAWLERMKASTSVALILGIEDTALIIVDDFPANISKSRYVEQSIPRKQVAEWIYNQTHSGRANEKSPRVAPSRE